MGSHVPRLLSTDEFYNMWCEPFYLRMIIDVRKQEFFKQTAPASMAVHYDPDGDETLDEVVQREIEGAYGLAVSVVLYDHSPYPLSRPLKALASRDKLHDLTIYCLEPGIESVKKKYDFIFQGKEEETAYPSVILDDFLYLGDEECSIDKDVIKNLGITHVLTALPESQFSYKFASKGVVYCQCPIQDISTDPINKYFSSAIQFIETAKESKNEKKPRVLVHCMAGVSRSPTLVLVYLMHSLKKTLKEAYLYVLARRSVIHPNEGFMRMLLQFEKDLFGRQSITLDELENL